MKEKIISLLLIFLVLSCDYKREQNLPKGVEIQEIGDPCSFNIYQASIKYLTGVEKTGIEQWENGLICEGYTDLLSLPWIEYKQVLPEHQDDLVYYLNSLEACINSKLEVNDLWVAACMTRLKETHGTRSNFHKVFVLDRKKSVLYEIANLN